MPFFRRRQNDRLPRTTAAESASVFYDLDAANTQVCLRFGNAQLCGDREQQQDAFGYSCLNDERISRHGVLAVLADGMGGLADGGEVSAYVVRSMLARFNDLLPDQSPAEQLAVMAKAINREVCGRFGNDGRIRAGSTLAVALVSQNRLFWLCAGDSRIYVWRHGAFYICNEDHHFLNCQLLEHVRGHLSLQEAINSEQADALTSYIGHPDLSELDYSRRGFALQRGDRILLCTDGVYHALSQADLADAQRLDPQSAADALAELIRNRRLPGQDNATILIIEFK